MPYPARYLILFTAVCALWSCKVPYHVSQASPELYPVTSAYSADTAILNFYRPYKLRLDSIMNDVVAESTKEIAKDRPEGLLNNFFADAMSESAKQKGIAFDFVFTNYGGLRVPLPAGEIRRFQIFELMPFENAFTTVKLSGSDTKALFNFIAAGGGDPISGASFTISGDQAMDIQINGKPLDLEKEYTVLTSDYMANGGDGGAVFSKALERKDYEYKLRDGIFDYLKMLRQSGEKLNPQIDGRIRVK